MPNEYYGAHTTPTSDFIAHYGVLGMKWGIHRAAQKGTNYSYQSHATKKYKKAAAKLLAKAEKATAKGNTEKSAKLKAKSSKMANRAKRSAEVDKGEEEYARSLSTGKALGLAALGGTNSLKGYAQNRAMAKQKGKKFTGEKLVAGVLAAHTGSYGSRLRKAAYIRQDEKRSGVGQKIRNFDTKIRNSAAKSINKDYNDLKRRRR